MVFAMFFLLLASCSRQTTLERDQYRLQNLVFKGNKQISTEELESVIPVNQKPNRKLFSILPVRVGVGWYNLGKLFYNEEKIEAKFKKWNTKIQALPTSPELMTPKTEKLRTRYQKRAIKKQEVLNTKENALMKNLGEAPAVISEGNIARTAKRIQKFLKDKGFIDNQVNFQIDSAGGNRKIKLTYFIDEQNRYRLDTISYEVEDKKIENLLKNSRTSLLKTNEPLDENTIKAEHESIELFLKEHGYFNFSERNYIRIDAIDTTDIAQRNYKVNLKLKIKNPINKTQHDQFTVQSVNFTAADATEALSGNASDTTQIFFKGINYTFIGKKYPVSLLNQQILIRPRELFKASNDNETKRQLYRLDQFMFANTVYTQLPDNQLRVNILAPSNFKYGTVFEPTINNISSIFGGGINASIKARNLLNYLDIFELGGRFALENQPSIVASQNALQYSREASINFSINLPKIIFSEKITNQLSLKNPKTQLIVGFSNSSLATYRRQNFRLSGNYSWQKSRYETILLTPFDINFTRTPYKSEEFKEAIKDEPTLKSTFGSQVVTSVSGSYVFNNQVLGQNIKARYWQIYAELGGSFLNLLKDKDNIGFINDVFPKDTIAYFRYWKVSTDFRKYFPIGKKNSWAYRINVGLAQPYGKNEAMPYERNFFIGGQNSIRAWSARSLGPGSSPVDTIASSVSGVKRFRQQPGDIILEASIEGRWFLTRFFGDIYLASFLDMGNVWKWYQVDSKLDKANFRFDKFYQEIAVGTGAGLRWDFQYFILRFDWGIKVFDPSQAKGKRFVLDNFNTRKYLSDNITPNPYRLQFQFGVGHPF
jgi:outer membrane protein insertion porin family